MVDGPFSSGDDASATSQAQHSNANDAPTDVNNNAIFGRSQGLSVDVLGKNFVNGANRLSVMADHGAGRLVAGHSPHDPSE